MTVIRQALTILFRAQAEMLHDLADLFEPSPDRVQLEVDQQPIWDDEGEDRFLVWPERRPTCVENEPSWREP